jgi:hypothetical protein
LGFCLRQGYGKTPTNRPDDVVFPFGRYSW